MAFTDAFACPACGAAINGVSPLTRSLSCDHCGNWVCFDNQRWIDAGQFEHQIQAPPFLHVNRAGSLNKRHFVVSGRIRLGAGGSFWDEWWLEFDDGEGQWLEEDDGSYHLHESQQHQLDASAVRATGVGQMLTVDGRSWFVTETNDAAVMGAEGQLPWSMQPGTGVFTLDAVADGRELSVEVWSDEVSASSSRMLAASELDWN